MDSKTIIIICAVCAVVVIGIVTAIILLRRKSKIPTEKDLLLESKQRIAVNTQIIEELLVQAENIDELKTHLCDIQEKLRYLTPSTSADVAKIDQDIRLELTSVNKNMGTYGDCATVMEEIAVKQLKNVKLLIARRSTFTHR